MNRLKNLITKYGAFALIPLWGIVCFAFFQGWYHFHFFYQEQNQLFLASSDYLLTYFEKPAWLSCLLGDWLTQFYYYLYAGPAILCLGLILVGCSTYYAIHVSGIKNDSLISASVYYGFSPSGKYIYYCVTNREGLRTQNLKGLQYALVRIPFDEQIGKFGAQAIRPSTRRTYVL